MDNKKIPSIYISHAWGGESEKIVNAILKRFQREGIPIILDKKDLGYRQSIGMFMQNLGKADAIIIVVSNKYLHSEYCMFELLQIYNSDNIYERIFPVVLDEVKIAKSTERLELVKYWENQSLELESKIRELQSLSNIEGITEDLNLYQNIRSKIAKLTSILKDINALNIQLHRDTDFNALIEAVKSQVIKREQMTYSSGTDGSNRQSLSANLISPEKYRRKRFGWIKWAIGGMVLLLLIWGFNSFLPLTKNKVPETTIFNDLNSDDPQYTMEDKNLISPVDSSDSVNPEMGDSNGEDLKPEPSVNKEEVKTFQNPLTNLDQENGSINKVEVNLLDSIEKKAVSEVPMNDHSKKDSVSNKEDQEAGKLIEVNIPEQQFTGVFTRNISSNEANEGDEFYLENITEIKVGNHTIVPRGAKVKCQVTQIRSGNINGRASLAVTVQSIQAINGEWLDVQYPELSDKGRGEVVFEKGMELTRLKLKNSKIKIIEND